MVMMAMTITLKMITMVMMAMVITFKMAEMLLMLILMMMIMLEEEDNDEEYDNVGGDDDEDDDDDRNYLKVLYVAPRAHIPKVGDIITGLCSQNSNADGDDNDD